MVKIKAPRTNIIEKTAVAMAAEFYEVGRASGMTSVHKSAKAYARANLEKFVPIAVSHLLEMLNNPNYNEHIKNTIYEAILERVHDPDTNLMQDNKLPDIDISKYLDHKPEPPIIVNTTRASEYDIVRIR